MEVFFQVQLDCVIFILMWWLEIRIRRRVNIRQVSVCLGNSWFFQGLIQRLKLHLHPLEISWDLNRRPKVQWFFYAISEFGARILPLDGHRIKIQDGVVM